MPHGRSCAWRRATAHWLCRECRHPHTVFCAIPDLLDLIIRCREGQRHGTRIQWRASDDVVSRARRRRNISDGLNDQFVGPNAGTHAHDIRHRRNGQLTNQPAREIEHSHTVLDVVHRYRNKTTADLMHGGQNLARLRRLWNHIPPLCWCRIAQVDRHQPAPRSVAVGEDIQRGTGGSNNLIRRISLTCDRLQGPVQGGTLRMAQVQYMQARQHPANPIAVRTSAFRDEKLAATARQGEFDHQVGGVIRRTEQRPVDRLWSAGHVVEHRRAFQGRPTLAIARRAAWWSV